MAWRNALLVALGLAWLGACAGDGEQGAATSADGAGAGGEGAHSNAGTAGSTSGAAGADATEGGSGVVMGEAGAAGGPAQPCVASPPVTLSHGNGRATQPRAVWTGAGYAVVWTDDRDGNTEIYFAEVDADGTQVGSELRLTDDPAASFEPSLVWNGSELGLTWSDARDGNTEMYFTALDPSGKRKASAVTDLRLTNDANRSEFGRLAWTGQEYGLTWSDTRDGDGGFSVYFAKLSRAGTKTTKDLRISEGVSSEIAAGEGGFGLVWFSGRDLLGLQIYFNQLDGAGAVLGEDRLLSDPEMRGGNPGIAFDGQRFGVAWQSNPGTGGEIQWTSVPAAGEPPVPVPLTESNDTVGAPSLRGQAGGGFALSWMDARNGVSDVHFLGLASDGQPLGPELAVTDDASNSTAPSLAVTPTGYGIAWLDGATDTAGSVQFRAFCSE